MESHSVVWGMDIGHTSLKAVKLQRQADRVMVLGYAIEPIESGEDIDRDEAVVKAMQSLAYREEMRGAPVIASLSGRQIFSRTINVPVLNPKKVDKMVELEARQQIPGNFDEVHWSYHLSPSMDGASNDVALFAARKEIVDDLVQKARKAGIELVGISVSSLAVYNFTEYDQEFADDESVVVLDVGAENTDLVVYQGDTLWMRTLGVSGNDITRAFMKKFRVSFEEAETLKCQVADSNQADRIIKVIEPSLAELVSDVQRSLGFYKSQNKEANFQSVVVSGNTFRLPGLAQFMADRLGYAIIELVELERIQLADGLDHDHFLDDLQSLGVAMGLGLQGLGAAKANVNLLPSAQRLQTLLKTKRWAAVVVLVMIITTWFFAYLIDSARMKENVQIKLEIESRVSQNENRQGAAADTAKQIIPLANIINEYDNYGGHVGVLYNIEREVLRVVEDVALIEGLIDEQLDRDPYSPSGDPIPQPVYLHALTLPSLNVNSELLPFDQLKTVRRVSLKVFVPHYARDIEVRNEIKARLEALTWDSVAWQSQHPGTAAQRDPGRIFNNVVPAERQEGETLDWTFLDKFFKNQETETLEEKRVEKRQSGYILTFNCEIGMDPSMAADAMAAAESGDGQSGL